MKIKSAQKEKLPLVRNKHKNTNFPIILRHTLKNPQIFATEKEALAEGQIERFLNESVLSITDLNNKTSLSLALLTWIENFGFRQADELDLKDQQMTYANTELNSIKYLRNFRDNKLHLYFNTKSREYKKAKKHISAMLKHYKTNDFQVYSNI